MPKPYLYPFEGVLESLVQDKIQSREHVKSLFEEWRDYTLHIIDTEHSDHSCILRDTRDKVREINIIPDFNFMPTAKAWVRPDKSIDTMWVNTNTEKPWARGDGVVTILHESLHLHKATGLSNGSFCGPDRDWSEKPLCVLFGKEIHVSSQISHALAVHLLEHTRDSKFAYDLLITERDLNEAVQVSERYWSTMRDYEKIIREPSVTDNETEDQLDQYFRRKTKPRRS